MAPEVAVDKKTMIKVVTKDFRKGVLKQHLEQLKIKYRKLEKNYKKNSFKGFLFSSESWTNGVFLLHVMGG